MATAQLKGSSSEERRAIFLFVCCSIIVDCLVFRVDVVVAAASWQFVFL
jgi:hypothetical protein